MTREEIINKAESFGIWYHHIKLADNYWPASNMQKSWPIWDMIRSVRKKVDYIGKSVLDIGTMDGMWGFEAEELGAGHICGVDIWQHQPRGKSRAEFAVQARGSKMRIEDGDVECLNLDMGGEVFDIIQCLGMLYHVENPMMALRQIRKCIAVGGVMLLETAMWHGPIAEPAIRFNSDNGIYHDSTTFWVPNAKALEDMLRLTGWIQDRDSIQVCSQPPNPIVARICMICRPS